MDMFFSFFTIVSIIYLINFPIYDKLKSQLLKRDYFRTFGAFKLISKHVKRYKLNTCIVEDSIPSSTDVDANTMKAFKAINDLHYYNKMHTFYLSDERSTIIFGECTSIIEGEKSNTINIYEIHLRKKTS